MPPQFYLSEPQINTVNIYIVQDYPNYPLPRLHVDHQDSGGHPFVIGRVVGSPRYWTTQNKLSSTCMNGHQFF
jgi:hypothetical protein